MSMPIFDRAARALSAGALALGLAACEVAPDGTVAPTRGFLSGLVGPEAGAGLEAMSDPNGGTGVEPPAAVELARGDIVVGGLEGYCIDPRSLRTSRQGAFAALGPCARIVDAEAPPVVEPLLLTVTVGPRRRGIDLPSAETFARLTGAPARPAEAPEGFVLVRLDTGGDQALEDGDPRHWRGVFQQNGRLVSLALYAPRDSVLAGDQGQRLMIEVYESISTLSDRSNAADAAGSGG
ncbi:dihydroxy-acid dehydratase [Litorisediminicola beolgyonensis]|uniref:Dihydroxy-acid dehydratase n=1 Tax=Litorisediminicola beolgyonensis TaxID=1173614 RepID=A0ABW3ZI58_9RHOB